MIPSTLAMISKGLTNIKWKRVGIASVLVLFIAQSDAFSQEKVRIAVHNYPPYYDTNCQGLLCDVFRAAFQAVGMEADILVYPIIRGKKYFFAKRVDAYCPHLFFSEAEAEQITWTPVASTSVCLFFYIPNQPRIPFASLEDLRGYSVVTVFDSPYIPIYKQHGLKVDKVRTPFELLRMIRAGRHPFFETTVLTGLFLVKSEFPKEWELFDHLVWSTQDIGLTFLKDTQHSQYVKQQFDKGLATIKQNGEYINIIESYWGKGNIPPYSLTNDMRAFGTTQFNPERFYLPQRTSYGKILK